MHKYGWNLTEIWKAFQSQISPFVQIRLSKTSSLRVSGCCLCANLESKEVDVTCDKHSSSLGFSVSGERTHPTCYKDLKLWNFPQKTHPTAFWNAMIISFFSRLVFPLNRAGYEVKHKLHILYTKMCILTAYIYLGSCFHAQTASPTSALVLGPQCLYQSQRHFSKGFFPLPQSRCRWSKLITGTARHNYKLWLLLSQPAQSDFLAGI